MCTVLGKMCYLTSLHEWLKLFSLVTIAVYGEDDGEINSVENILTVNSERFFLLIIFANNYCRIRTKETYVRV
jgi:hypothetical protein